MTKHYVPILKWKQGEYTALKEIPANIREWITPLVEIPPIPWDFVNEAPAKTIDAHLKGIADHVLRNWGLDQRLFFDLNFIPAEERMASGQHPLGFLFHEFHSRSIQAVPVTGLSRDPDYQVEVAHIHARDGAGVCLRLEAADFSQPMQPSIDALLTQIGASPVEVDLVLDFKHITQENRSLVGVALSSLIPTLPYLAAWRTLTVAASSFPVDLSSVTANSTSTFSRIEWALWLSIYSTGTLPRTPAFGDYAISHPEPNEIDPRLMRMSASIRYTSDFDWFILKGQNVRDHGFVQYVALCGQLMASGFYKGAAYSWGDQYISDCCAGTDGPGNATTWRKVGTNHHITVVVDQISSLP